MARFGRRSFLKGWNYEIETRVVDLDDPSAPIPSGSVLLCEEGHVAAVVENSIPHNSRVEAADFAALQIGMQFKAGQLFPACRCGARLVRFTRRGLAKHASFNVQGKGWT